MSEDQLASFLTIGRNVVSEEETQYHFADANIMPSEPEAAILPVCTG